MYGLIYGFRWKMIGISRYFINMDANAKQTTPRREGQEPDGHDSGAAHTIAAASTVGRRLAGGPNNWII